MNADEQRARELLAAAYRDADQHEDAYAVANGVNAEGAYGPELAAIMAALAQQVPEGMVLVPREPTIADLDCLMASLPHEWGNGTTFGYDDAREAYAAIATPQTPQPELPKSVAIGSKSVDGDVAAEILAYSMDEAQCWDAKDRKWIIPQDTLRDWAQRLFGAYSANTGGVQQGVVACGFRYRAAPNEECRSRPWTGAGIVAEWGKPTPPDNKTIQYQTLYTTYSANTGGACEETAQRMGYASVMDALDDLADYRKDATGQQAVTDAMARRLMHALPLGCAGMVDVAAATHALTAALAAHGKGG